MPFDSHISCSVHLDPSLYQPSTFRLYPLAVPTETFLQAPAFIPTLLCPLGAQTKTTLPVPAFTPICIPSSFPQCSPRIFSLPPASRLSASLTLLAAALISTCSLYSLPHHTFVITDRTRGRVREMLGRRWTVQFHAAGLLTGSLICIASAYWGVFVNVPAHLFCFVLFSSCTASLPLSLSAR